MKAETLKTIAIITGILLLSSALSDLIFSGIYPLNHYLWRGLGMLLIAIPTIGYLRHSWLQKGRLTGALWLIFFIIGTFNILIEAYLFNIITRVETFQGMLQGFLSVTPGILAIGFLYTGRLAQAQKALRKQHSVIGYIWRILTGNVLYFIFYASAGMILQASYPELMEFYEDKIPPIILIIQTNLFFRGFVFVSIAILIAQTTELNKWRTGVLIGLFFSILGGIAPLLSPNELMPIHIRLAHGFEVGISNFLYGLILGVMFTPRKLSQATD